MNNIINKIQEHNANRKLQILKGFVEIEDVLEKAVYSDNSQNRKLQRVGKTYGGKKEDEKSDKEDTVNEDDKKSKSDGQKVDYSDKDNIEQMKVHAESTDTEDLKKFLESANPEDEDDAQLVKYAKKELQSRGELVDQSIPPPDGSKEDKASQKFDEKEERRLNEAENNSDNFEDEDNNKIESHEELINLISDCEANNKKLNSNSFSKILENLDSDKPDYDKAIKLLEDFAANDRGETIKLDSIWKIIDSVESENNSKNLTSKIDKVDESIKDLKKHLSPKKTK